MPKRPLDTPRARARRTQLLEAGFKHFADQDYDDVQLEAITAAVGCSHGLLFQYFGTKKGFYLAVVEHLLEGFLTTTTLHADNRDEQLATGLDAYIGWAIEHPRAYVSIMRATSRFGEVRELLEQTRNVILRRIAEAVDLPPDDARARLAIRSWIGGMEAALLCYLDNGEAILREDLIVYMRTTLTASIGWARAGAENG